MRPITKAGPWVDGKQGAEKAWKEVGRKEILKEEGECEVDDGDIHVVPEKEVESGVGPVDVDKGKNVLDDGGPLPVANCVILEEGSGEGGSGSKEQGLELGEMREGECNTLVTWQSEGNW